MGKISYIHLFTLSTYNHNLESGFPLLYRDKNFLDVA
jgi:hypothetical protein